MKMALYIALCSAREGQFKVGVTLNPDGRKGTLAAKEKGRIQMPTVLWLDTKQEALRLEHDTLWTLRRAGIHVSGEWFRGTVAVGLWGLYEALKRRHQSYIDGPDYREMPLIEHTLGFFVGHRLKVFDWTKINDTLRNIERA